MANTSARSTNAAFDKCYIDSDSSNDCAETGAYDSLTWDDGTGATTLPSWITFTSSGSTTQTVSINPPDGTVVGTHSLIAVFNPTNGSDKTFTALTFTVTCEVTSWTVPSAPTTGGGFDLSYAVFETPLTIDVSTLSYVQSPACGYAFTSTYSWNGLTSYMTEAPTGSGAIIVSTSNLSNVSTTSVYFTNSIAIASNGPAGSSTFNLNASNQQVSFDIAVTDPCAASTANTVVFKDGSGNTITDITVTDGGTTTVTIDAPTNSFAVSDGVADRCGSISAAVYTDNNGSNTNPTNNWATITGPDFTTGAYTLTIDTTADLTLISDEASVAKTLYIFTQLVDYTSQTQYSSFTVNIGETTCDCTALLWTSPSVTSVSLAVGSTDTPTFPLPTADTTNTASNNAFAKCYAGSSPPGCASTGSFSASDVKYDDGSASGTSLPSWMTFTTSGTST